MELEATQAAGLVLGVKSYGASDELDYHSPWDHIKVAAEAEHGLLKKRPALADVAHDDHSICIGAVCASAPGPRSPHCVHCRQEEAVECGQ